MARTLASVCVAVCCLSASASNSGLQASSSAAIKAKQQALEKSWEMELEGQVPVKVNGELVNTKDTKIVEYKSPITRVVNLLEKMRAQLIAEADKEAEMYDQMVCWCETNEKEKKKAIADADALSKELETEIQERSAKLGKVVTEIEILKEQIAEDTESLKTATAIREKEAAKFREENKDLVQWITNVKNAIIILEKRQGHYNKGGPEGEAFVQLDAPVLSSIRTVLKDLAFKAQMFEAGKSDMHRKQTGTSFLSLGTDSESLGDKLLSVFDNDEFASGAVPLDIAQRVLADNAKKVAPQASFLQGGLAPTAGSYSTRSSVIFGILTQMKEEFEANLSQEQKEEMKAQEDFKLMAKAKAEQIEVAKEKLDELETANADNIKALSDAKENLELTREQRSKDVEFLQNLKVTCMDLDNQWEIRSKTRAEETQAVSEALAVIKGDDNMDLLRDTVKFIQVESESQQQATMRMRRTNTMAFLRKAAQAPGFEADDLLAAWRNRDGNQQVSMIGAAAGPRMQLSTLAVSVGLDTFTQIKAAMDKMVAELKEEQEEEVKFKEYCTKELNLNEKQTYEKTEQKEDLEALIDKLNKLIKKLNEEIADHNKQIADTEVAIKKASQVREEENAEFQTTVADQRATQDILHKALQKLKSFYKTDKGGRPGVFAQQEPPVKFNAYKKNAGANPVIGLIEQIVEDSKKLEKDAVDAETEAQSNYETFVADSNALIKQLSDAIAAKTKAVAKATEDLEQGKSDLQSTIEELQSLAMTAHALHGECDWVLRNFELRQKARLQEMEAIGQAKAILSGEGIVGQ